MTKAFLNRARMSVSGTPGTGAITLNAAISTFQTFAAAGITDGQTVSYIAEDGAAWEIGTGTYTASGTSLARTTITETSNGNTTPLTLSSNTLVTATVQASDMTSGGSSEGWEKLTFTNTTTIFGTAGTYVSDQTFTVAANEVLQIEGFVYKSSGNNGLLGISEDGSHGYVIYNGTSGSTATNYYNGSYNGMASGSSANWTGLHEIDLSASVIGSTDNAVWGMVDGSPLTAVVDTNINLVGTVTVYLVTNDITKCAFKARVVTPSVYG